MQSADDLICAVLRGERTPFAGDGGIAATHLLLERANVHGVEALVHAHLKPGQWPTGVARTLRERAVHGAMWELRHQQVLAETLAALDADGIQPVLIKGTALAYSQYLDPALRTRGDTDLIIPISARDKVHDLLLALGYKRGFGIHGDFVSYQASFTKLSPSGGSHTLDVHWKINNSEVLSRLFTYDELRRDAEPLPALCPPALAASPVHALLLACMHRSTHKQNPYHINGHAHHSADRLIWLYDIHLLCSRLTSNDWTDFLTLAHQKGLRSVCLEGMQKAHDRFGTVCPAAILTPLAQHRPLEKPARYLNASKVRQQWMDFSALGNLWRQGRFLREVLFPPATFMLRKYPHYSSTSLPWLYVWRALSGILNAVRPRP